MAKTYVPELAKKIDLLIKYGLYKNRVAIAAKLKCSTETIKWWIYGDKAREPGCVSGSGMRRVHDLFAAALPDLSRPKVEQLMLGPADDIERLLAPLQADSLIALVRKEAVTTATTLFDERGGSLGLVETTKARKPAPHYTVKKSKLFRLAFKTHLRGAFTIAFQKSPGGWGIVPSDAEKAVLHVPGRDEEGELAVMCEHNEVGRHTFIIAQSTKPFPEQLIAAQADGVQLDRILLGHFAADYRVRPKTTKSLFSVNIEITS
ncbi:hypothetical protein [uncultured Roseobacter sp.]|uniref:hypothetical protein n=1 Tax=uncultured Roseobacter sp. TaxID=114847 RepID=UPI00261B52DD|nr:hypothetical protein [uncultured Roseobacter sp.]